MARKIKNVVVFAGNDCLVDEFRRYFLNIAYETGKLLAQNGFVTITGSGAGLMDEVSRGACESGGKTKGIGLNLKERKHSKYVQEILVFDTLKERQKRLIDCGDAFFALPGGIGTVFEIFNIIAFKRVGEVLPEKPMILIDGYYNKFFSLVQEMVNNGFIDNSVFKLFSHVKTPRQGIEFLTQKRDG